MKNSTPVWPNLSPDQKYCIDLIKHQYDEELQFSKAEIKERPKPLRLIIHGGGGCGKSFLIKIIAEMIQRFSQSLFRQVVLLAPAGIAAHNIQGQTIHSALALPVEHYGSTEFLPLNPQRLSELRNDFKNLTAVIIDEISMVGLKMFTHIHKRLNEIKGLSEDSFAYLGNFNIFAFGDFYQLRPVFDRFVFHSNNDVGVHLWRDLFKPVFLTTNHRQKDNQYLQLLTSVRVGELPEECDELLKTRLFTVEEINNKDEFKSALRIFSTRKQAAAYNAERLDDLAK